MPHTNADETRIKTIAAALFDERQQKEKPLIIAGIMAQVTPQLEILGERIDVLDIGHQAIRNQANRLEEGIKGIYPRLDSQDDRMDKKLNRMEDKIDTTCDKVTLLCARNDRHDGASDARKTIVKGFWALIATGAFAKAAQYAWGHWVKL